MFINKLLKVSNKVVKAYEQYNNIVNNSAAKRMAPNSVFNEKVSKVNLGKCSKSKMPLDTVELKKCSNTSSTPFQKSYITSKYKCIEALNSSKPKEIAYILDSKSGKVLGEFSGDAKSCVIDGKITGDNMVLLHGHPALKGSSKTLPLSLQDFIVLNSNDGLKQIIAFDKNGNKYSLKKLEEFQKLSKSQIKSLKSGYLKYLLENSSKADTKHIDSLMAYCKANPNNCESIKWKVAEEITNLQYKESAVELIDSFWKNNAKSLNLEYYSGI